MNNTTRLIFMNDKTHGDIDQFWNNCFDGEENYDHMNEYVPQMYRVPNKNAIANFLHHTPNSWLIKRIKEQDIIGFAVHGDYIPGRPNNIGFNIGGQYIRQGYATETINALIDFLLEKGLTETFAHCLESNIPAINTMERCGFENLGRTGRQFNDVYETKLRKQIGG